MTPDELTAGLRFATPALKLRIAGIMELVAEAFEIPACALLERTRIPRVAEPRQVAMALIRDFSCLSLMDIGHIFSKDHGTVLHAIKACRQRYAANARFRERVEEISRQVRHQFSA